MFGAMSFDGLSEALQRGIPEPPIEMVALVRSATGGGLEIDLTMRGDNWTRITSGDVGPSIQFVGKKQIGLDATAKSYTVARFELLKDANPALLWAAVQDLQRSLSSTKAALHSELMRQGRSVIMADSLASGICECNGGDKCCCPDGYDCCNHDKRCCCQSR